MIGEVRDELATQRKFVIRQYAQTIGSVKDGYVLA